MDLRCIGIEKSFGANRALAGANLSVTSGSIHALLGENGAGKSTLNHIISGALRADAGHIELNGEEVQYASPLDAAAARVGMVHQHFLLAEALTVAENIALGMRRGAAGLRFNANEAEASVTRLAAESGLEVDPRARVAELSVGMRQRVEILKALSHGAELLLLDEPTAVLAPAEVARLFETLRKLRGEGKTIVIVTHKLDEVFAIASAVTVLRRGVTVFESALADTNPTELAHAMIGREPPRLTLESQARPGAAVLELRDASVPGALDAKTMEIRAGEIAGVAGVEGNGQNELAGLIAGMVECRAGTLTLVGRDIRSMNIRERADAGVALIPADRQREGLVAQLTLAENLFLRNPPVRRGALDVARMNELAGERLREFNVAPPEPELAAGALSGGNQQKVVAARELSRAPKLIIAANPTRGLDVGAAVEIQNRLTAAARENGAAVLLISSDLDEVLALSDRVYALYKGRLSEVGPRGVTRERVGRAMVGVDEARAP